MALFVLGDPHLSLGASKPMDIFPGWNDYVDRLEKNWRKLITPQDTIVLAGDISWAMRLTDTRKDFAFLQQLPGQKIIMKGNHDYWWSTANKMNAYLKAEGFDTLHIMHNNSYSVEGYAGCGARAGKAGVSALSAGLHRHQGPGDRSHPEGVRHQDLLLRASAWQRHPVCRTGRGGRHPVQAGKCRWPAFLPLPHQLTVIEKGKNDKI